MSDELKRSETTTAQPQLQSTPELVIRDDVSVAPQQQAAAPSLPPPLPAGDEAMQPAGALAHGATQAAPHTDHDEDEDADEDEDDDLDEVSTESFKKRKEKGLWLKYLAGVIAVLLIGTAIVYMFTHPGLFPQGASPTTGGGIDSAPSWNQDYGQSYQSPSSLPAE